MRVACALVPDFEVAVELARQPRLVGRPVVVGGLPHERKTVRSLSREAAARGVVEGMTLRRARALCPEAVFLPPRDELYQEAFARLLRVLEGFSPTVEANGGWTPAQPARATPHPALGAQDRGGRDARAPGSTRHPAPGAHSSVLVYLDAAGLERLFGTNRELGRRIAATVERETGLRPQVGIGNGRFVARVAAIQAEPGSALVVDEGKERSFLAPLPVELLPCSAEMQRRLALLGLRTLGQLADLQPGAMGEQFGPEGARAHRLARGKDDIPLSPWKAPRLLEEDVEIDPPTGHRGILLSAISPLMERMAARMRSEFLACREVTIQLGFSDGTTVRASTTLHEPTDDPGELMQAVERLLERMQPSATPAPREGRDLGISSIRLTISGFGCPDGEQLGLFRSRGDGLRRALRAVQRANEWLGEGAIRPLAEVAMEGAARPIRVIADRAGQPAALVLAGRLEPVLALCNRWRVRGDWWRREVYRDYFRLITESGRLCVVFRDLATQPPSLLEKGERLATWFLERIYG